MREPILRSKVKGFVDIFPEVEARVVSLRKSDHNIAFFLADFGNIKTCLNKIIRVGEKLFVNHWVLTSTLIFTEPSKDKLFELLFLFRRNHVPDFRSPKEMKVDYREMIVFHMKTKD